MEVLKVSSKSKPSSVAGALANAFRERLLLMEKNVQLLNLLLKQENKLAMPTFLKN